MPRQAYACPKCNKDVVKLTQHLRTMHQMSAEDGAALASRTRRQGYRADSQGHVYYECAKCYRVVARKGRHLTSKYHNMNPKSEEYMVALKAWFVNAATPKRRKWAGRPIEGVTMDDGMTAEEFRAKKSEALRAQLVFMTPEDCRFERFSRTLPAGCKMFPIVERFIDYSKSRAGGFKTVHTEDGGYVNRFLAFCDYERKGWIDVNSQNIRLHDDLLRKNVSPGTSCRIINNMQNFLQFAKHEGEHIEHFDACIYQLKRLCSATNKEKMVRRNERRIDIDRNLFTLADLKAFHESDFVRKTLAKFRKEPCRMLNKKVVGILAIMMSVVNAPRPSHLANLRITDVLNPTTEDDCMVLDVANYKTARSFGPSFLTLRPSVYKTLLHYTNWVQEEFDLQDGQQVFRDFYGKPLTKFWYAVSQAWSRAGLDSLYTHTLNRKFTTIMARERFPDLRSRIARVLAHSERTADVYYMIRPERKAVAQTCSLMFGSFWEDRNVEEMHAQLNRGRVDQPGKDVDKLLRFLETDNKDMETGEGPTDERDWSESDGTSDDDQGTTESTSDMEGEVVPVAGPSTESGNRGKRLSQEEVRQLLQSSEESDSETTTPVEPPKRRKRMNSATEEEIRHLFEEFIQKGIKAPKIQCPSMAYVRQKRSGQLKGITDKQICDKVRSIIMAARREALR